MPKTYPTDYDWWISTSSRTFRKLGTKLTAFNNSFINHKTLSACTPLEITALDALYNVWIQSKGGTATRITTTREPQATELRKKLVAACSTLGVASACTMGGGPQRVVEAVAPAVVVPVPRVRRAGGTPLDWVNEVRDALNRFNETNYAVNDAGAFPGDIAPGKTKAVLDKLAAVNKTNPSLAWTLAEPNLPRGNTEWDESVVRPAYRRLHGATPDSKIGVCTSFAKAAAYILTKDRETGPLVELVSFTGRPGVAHVYVIVGREGGYAEGTKLPPPSTWGAQTVIVDAWLGAMGFKVIFGVGEFPNQGYLRNAKADMIRAAS